MNVDIPSDPAPGAEGVIGALADIVGSRHVLVGADVTERFDGYPPRTPLSALCIVRPGSTEEVSQVLRLCDRNGVKVVPHGGRTGLVKGGRARPEDVVLSLERMADIESLDPRGATMTVGAGVPLQKVQEAASEAGLLYPVDIGARGSATIGGTIPTNAGGVNVLRYGMTRDQVLGIEVVLADGTILSSMNRMMKNNAGFDLKQLFIGSEGTLGIVTRAVLRLRPDPGPSATAMVALDRFGAVLDFLALAGPAAEGALTSFEVMWSEHLETVLDSGRHPRPFQGSHAFYVLLDIAGSGSEGKLQHVIEAAWEAGLVADAVITGSSAQAAQLWAMREDGASIAAAYQNVFYYDVSLPQPAMERYIEDLREALVARWPGARLFALGHIADGNLHLGVCTGDADHEAADLEVYRLLEPLGGSISAEHGIGLEKSAYLPFSRTPEEIATMRRIKRMLDPNDTLNPGKVLPAEA